MNVNLRHLLRPALLAVLLVTAAVTGCTGSDDDSTDTSTDTSTETTDGSDVTTDSTVDDGSTETSESTDTTTADTSQTTATTASTGTSTSGDAAGAPVPDGSGCTPGSDDTLPDGRWFGYASSREADSFSFDLACWFTGDDAAAAASEDGAESPPPNDYYIRNDNPTDRLLIPSPDATVEFLANPGDPSTVETIDYPTWVTVAPDRAFEPGIWVEISEGLVVTIEEQYQP